MEAEVDSSVSFEKDIAPVFRQFRGSMMWRFDLTDYGDVKSNASAIYGQISTQQMPPGPFPTLTSEQIALFKTWMDSGFPA
jgi:hypothetical protein